MPCLSCKRDLKPVARGLCNACYSRWRKTGTTEYQRWGKRSVCQIKDCGKRAVSHGLCDTHRKRLERHGHTEQTRSDSWGAKEKHPLLNAWRHLRRFRSIQRVCSEWQDDFLQFIADVGERPSPKHKLFAADETKPIGPRNFVWKRSLIEKVPGEDERTYLARWQRASRSIRKEAHRGYDLKKNYGMNREEYAALVIAQDGECAICGEQETTVIRGKTISLAVDHDHVTGKIRGLLCINCNRALGMFKDDPKRLRKAIRYLKRDQKAG